MVPVALTDDHPPEQPTDLALTPDGGIVLMASHTPGQNPDAGVWAAYVIQFDPDGNERWRKVFDGSGDGLVIAAAPSGNVVVAGSFQKSMSIGEHRLQDDPDDYHQFVAEFEPDGKVVGLRQLDLPESIVGGEIDVVPNAATMHGDQLVMAGRYLVGGDPVAPNGYYAAAYGLDGTLVSERLVPVTDSDPFGAGFGPVAADATPEGPVALAGAFVGQVDLGGGEVDGGQDDLGRPIDRPFIAVFDSLADTDVGVE
jgi:hypothetical protein